ncbi:hypothetical protein [Anaplasma phagocytophilum]|nr:hypothetical protein [Anaplasma phagocytophilum]
MYVRNSSALVGYYNVADASRLLCCGAVLSIIVQVILMLDSEVSGMQYMSSVACAA